MYEEKKEKERNAQRKKPFKQKREGNAKNVKKKGYTCEGLNINCRQELNSIWAPIIL